MFDLQPHGPDTYVGIGPRYPWGGLYGGQIVAQALRAAAATVEAEFDVHSLRAYFIRRGDHAEPVRYEVDRIRNGRSFVTRRVVARQAVGAILNLEASFQREEQSPVVQTVTAPDVAGASLDHTIWFHRPLRADRWHLHDVTCHAFAGNRGLTLGHVFAADGSHVATFAQEFLLRG